MTSFERGRAALELLVAEHNIELPLNEATTRLRLIDRLLLDCLGWTPEDLDAEQYQSGEYLDYVLGTRERHGVLEAKRTTKIFDLPAGTDGHRYVDIRTVRSHSASNLAAIDQVVGYCQTGGVPVAILSNGTELLAFLGSRQDGLAPLDGKALLFSSLQDMSSDYSTLWDMLSKEGMQSGILRRRLSRRATSAPPPERLSARLANYPGFRARSELETDVKILADLFLQDLVQEDEVSDDFLRECYCSSGALSQYALVSKEILRSRYAAIEDSATVEAVRGRRQGTSKLSADLLSAALTRRPLILLGDVGVGKTIFLKHFFRVEALEVLDRSIVFYVDFLSESSILLDVRAHLFKSVQKTIETSLGVDLYEGQFIRAVYNREINQFKRGLYGPLQESDPASYARAETEMLLRVVSDELEHLRRSLEHLRGSRQLSFVLILDNIDHHEFEFQERVLVVGQSMAETWPVSVFMSLRPDTFYRSRKGGSLTAYQPRIFMVEPPRTDLVINKRLLFARKQLEETGRLEAFPAGLTIDSASLVVYIDMLIEAFESNDRLKELVDNLSSGNVRQALDFVSTFVGSGYVSTERILDIARRGRQYTLPLHEFIRAILFGEYSYYDPSASPVCNIFDIVSNDGKEHFALPILLAFVQYRGESLPGGFVDEGIVYEHLQSLGYSIEQIESHLARALSSKLVITSSSTSGPRSLRVTEAGGYMHKRMLTVFAYVDAVIVDTPIVQPDVRHRIRDVRSIEDRLSRAAIFIDYLDTQWPFHLGETPFDWDEVGAAARRDVELAEAKRRARRHR